MNMTVVIVTRQSAAMEFLAVALVCALAALAVWPVLAVAGHMEELQTDKLLSATAAAAADDESRELEDGQLGSLVRELGGQLEHDMESQMGKLMGELEGARSQRRPGALDEPELVRLREAQRLAAQDIRARVALAGDTSGALPQWGLANKASSLLAATSERLASASSYVSTKLRSIGAKFSAKLPRKLRRFFRWPTFMAFKVRHHKVYKSVREELYRQMVFLRTHVKVGMQHLRFLLRRDRHLLGANQYADMLPREIRAEINNDALAEEKRQLQAEGLTPAEHQQMVAGLKRLAARGENIFGKQQAVVQTKKGARTESERDAGTATPSSQRGRRRRRSADDELAADSELEAEEEDDEEDGDGDGDDTEALESELAASDESDGDTLADYDSDDETYKLLDEFAGVDLSGLNELESNVDEALGNGGATHNNNNNNFESNNTGGGGGGPLPPFEPIDLRTTGCIVRPENQNGCGHCYSQAVTAAAAYYNCMGANEGRLVRYHPKFTSDCGKYLAEEGRKGFIHGCAGGRISEAIRFQKLVGLPTFGDYNVAMVSAMVMDEDRCAYPRPEGSLEAHDWPIKLHPIEHFINSRYTLLELDEVDLHLRTVGPVLVDICTWENFEFYEAGIYDGRDQVEHPGLHSMLVVGHDRDAQGRHYYIIWNSAGIVWGERGYLRISAEALQFFLLKFVGLPPNKID